MNIDNPISTTNEIEKIRSELMHAIFIYGLKNNNTILISQNLDELIIEEIKKKNKL